MGLHSGPVSSAVPETPGGLTHHTLGSPPQRPHKQDWPLTRASARGLPRTASHASPPCTRKTRYTPTAQCHTTGVHTLHTTQLHARASFARAGGSTHTQPPADTHVLPHTSPLPAAARPPPFPAMQTSDFFSGPAEERPLVPGPGGRGSRSRQPNTAALSHPVAPGGAGLWCAEMHEACGFWRSAPFQHLTQYPPPQLLFLPSCLLCPGLSTSLLSRFWGSLFSLLTHGFPLQDDLKRIVLPLPPLPWGTISLVALAHSGACFWRSLRHPLGDHSLL